MESDSSLSEDGENPQKPGHLILLDGPNLGAERRITDFNFKVSGRVGKQVYRLIIEKMDQQGQGKHFKDPKFLPDTALFDTRISEKLKEGTIEARRKRMREKHTKEWANVRFVRLKHHYKKESLYTLFNQIKPNDIC